MVTPVNISDEFLNMEFIGLHYTHLAPLTHVLPHPSGLNLIHVNIRSLKLNFHKLLTFLENLSFIPTVIALSELWLEEGFVETFDIPGYTFEYKLRSDSPYGGCGCYIKSEVKYDRLPLIESSLPECESVCITLRFDDGMRYPISCIYRAPRCDFYRFCNALPIFLTSLSREGKVSLVGDFNIDYLHLHKHHNFFYTLLQFKLKACITEA